MMDESEFKEYGVFNIEDMKKNADDCNCEGFAENFGLSLGYLLAEERRTGDLNAKKVAETTGKTLGEFHKNCECSHRKAPGNKRYIIEFDNTLMEKHVGWGAHEKLRDEITKAALDASKARSDCDCTKMVASQANAIMKFTALTGMLIMSGKYRDKQFFDELQNIYNYLGSIHDKFNETCFCRKV